MKFHIFPTRLECSLKTMNFPVAVQTDKLKNTCPGRSSEMDGFLHSFGVRFYNFSTRLECSFTTFPLVLSVVLAPAAGGTALGTAPTGTSSLYEGGR